MNILYDLDGTLINSNKDHAEVMCEILKENGKIVHVDDMLIKQSGTLSTRLFSAYLHLSHNKPEDHEKILELDREKWYRMDLRIPDIKPVEGAFDFIKKMHYEGFNQGIVSVSDIGFIEKILQYHGVYKDHEYIISSITTAYETGVDKHHPKIFFEALSKHRFEGNESVLFDDSARAIHASKITGIKTIAVCGRIVDSYNSNMIIGDFTRITPDDVKKLLMDEMPFTYYPKRGY